MADNFLETGTVNHNFSGYGYDRVLAELNSDMRENDTKINHLRQMAENADDDAIKLKLEDEYRAALEIRQSLIDGLELIKEYPDEFPVLYAMISREDTDETLVKFELNEVLAQTDEIVTEAQDVMPKGKQLELSCELPDAGKFGIVVTPYDKAGENDQQLKARINFDSKTIDNLNQTRLKAILEFCEKKGLSVYDLTIPYKDGVIAVDEKLAELTKKFLENRKVEDVQNPGAMPDDENNFVIFDVKVDDINLDANQKSSKPKKKPITLDAIYKETVEFIENDLKKTRNRSYFEKIKEVNGIKSYVFSLYDKPNKDNEKLDGVKDKNGVFVPTYSYRLYVAQDPKTQKFSFGYAVPGGKKMDDSMAGDFVGIMKKTGVTHLRFHNISNANKGVWMMACAEKGIVPIGISINTAKAKAMVEAARKKLTTEEFVEFKYRLAEQMLENAQKKCKDKNDKYLGLSKSEFDYITDLKSARNFESFRRAYEDVLYNNVLEQIDKGSKNSEKGAAITFGSMRALRSVFDIYWGHQNETFGQRLENIRDIVSLEDANKLSAIPQSKKLYELNSEEFLLLYNTILPHHIDNAENDILQAYSRELKRKPQRADAVVLASDLFPRAKGAVNEINIILTRNGIDTLTLPLEHKGLEFTRPANLNSNSSINNAQIQPVVNQGMQHAR